MKKNTDEYWIHHISKFEDSGLTQVEYCRANRINKSSFSARKSLLRREGEISQKMKQPSFIKAEEAPKNITISINGGFEISFSEVPSSQWMANFIKELGNGPVPAHSH